MFLDFVIYHEFICTIFSSYDHAFLFLLANFQSIRRFKKLQEKGSKDCKVVYLMLQKKGLCHVIQRIQLHDFG